MDFMKIKTYGGEVAVVSVGYAGLTAPQKRASLQMVIEGLLGSDYSTVVIQNADPVGSAVRGSLSRIFNAKIVGGWISVERGGTNEASA
jgi:hypothetical protein